MTQGMLSLEFLAGKSKLQIAEMRELRKVMANMMASLARIEETVGDVVQGVAIFENKF